MAHINELIDYVTETFIVFNGKVLLVYHKALQKWLPVGGHIELDEDPEQALLREVKEESGLDVEVIGKKAEVERPGFKSLFTPSYLDIHNITETHRHVGLVYFCKASTDRVQLEEDEHEQIRWFSEEDLENPEYKLMDDVKFYIREALKAV